MVRFLERTLFRARALVLVLLALVTGAAGYAALDLHMDAGFVKVLPQDHPYIQTYLKYQERLTGTNRIAVILENRNGTIYEPGYLATLRQLTDDLGFISVGGTAGVTGIWTPNTRFYEVTEEGFEGRNLIPSTVTDDTIDAEVIAQLREDVARGGFDGLLVSEDERSSLVVGELLDTDMKTRERLDYFALGARLENEIRAKYSSEAHEVHIIGFAQAVSDIATQGSESVPLFFAIAFVITYIAVLLYVQSLTLAAITVGCSLASVIWQYGLLTILGIGLDPFAILIPFLIFAIGASHGVQQINRFSRELQHGASSEAAARAAFSALFAPGIGALLTDLVGFATLMLIAIPMIQEVAIAASIGVALKIVSNLIMLPLIASYYRPSHHYRARVERARQWPHAIMHAVASVAHPVAARFIFIISLFILGFGIWKAMTLPVGDTTPGVPELHPDSRYNRDTAFLAENFIFGTDVLMVVMETPEQACLSPETVKLQRRFSAYMEGIEGVRSVSSLSSLVVKLNALFNGGNPKYLVISSDSGALAESISPLTPSDGFFDADCKVLPVYVFLENSYDVTLRRVTQAIDEWRQKNGLGLALTPTATPRLGLGETDADVCWRARDDRSGTWRLLPAELSAVSYTVQPEAPLSDGAPRELTISGYAAAPARAATGTQLVRAPAVWAGISPAPCPFEEEITRPETPDARTALWSFTMALPEGKPGETVPLDIAAAMKAEGIETGEAGEIRVSDVPLSTHFRLASGNAGVAAGVNEVIAKSEVPSMIVVYLAVVIFVFLTYFDWRASLICLVPLTLATWLGYSFMAFMGIGLKITTLPVLVIAVGIGVDYAFYIYSRIEHHFAHGRTVTHAYQRAVLETGVAVAITGVVLAAGVATWAFSPLKFQADMGLLMSFMFLTNMVMAVIVMPAWAVALDILVPRRRVAHPPTDEHPHG